MNRVVLVNPEKKATLVYYEKDIDLRTNYVIQLLRETGWFIRV